jgi:L,D-transpeptidase ErfK/SrfK
MVMNQRMRTFAFRSLVLGTALIAAGCSSFGRQRQPVVQAPPAPPPIQAPVATNEFTFDPATDDVVGQLQVTRVEGEDTLSDIARRFNLGYEEVVRANPGIDPWLPGVGREVILPTQFVLPDAPREGLVINLAQLRVFYYPKVKTGEPRTVITHPIGIGKVGWQTPEGSTKVISKKKNPTWTPPASVRKEHREAGDPLPAVVPPGPDNPLGTHMMTLGWPSYLIHGTNKPYGVGMRSSHGCMRFYPEDIAELYDKIPVGTKVTVVNQPFVFGWHQDALYVQAFPILEDDDRAHPQSTEDLLKAGIPPRMSQQVQAHGGSIDANLVTALVTYPRGVAIPVTRTGVTLDSFVTAARHVENRVPEGSNWNGKDELLVTAEEVEAARAGTILPAKPVAKRVRKPAAAAPVKKAAIVPLPGAGASTSTAR